MQHHFDTKIAERYDITTAVLLDNFYFWIEKNRANNKHFYDGRYWTYNSVKALTTLFPYFTKRQIEYALKKLIREKILIQGNYNENPYDRTLWYAFTDLGYSIVQNCEIECSNFEKSINENCEMYIEQNCEMNYNDTDNYTDDLETIKEKTNTIVLVKEKNKIPPTLDEVIAYCEERGNKVNPERFFNHYEANGWKVGKNPMKNWKAAIRYWEQNQQSIGQSDKLMVHNGYVPPQKTAAQIENERILGIMDKIWREAKEEEEKNGKK